MEAASVGCSARWVPGLAVRSAQSGKIVYVPGERVGLIYPGRVTLKIASAEAGTLEPFQAPPPGDEVAAGQAAWPTFQMDARRPLALAPGERTPPSGVIPEHWPRRVTRPPRPPRPSMSDRSSTGRNGEG